MTLILIKSKNDDSFCARSLADYTEYSTTIFKRLTDMEFIPTLHDEKNLPKMMNSGDYFIIRESNFSMDVLNSKIELTLYQITDVEIGWIRSTKKRTSVQVKKITGTCIDMYTGVSLEEHLNEKIYNNDINLLNKIISSLPENWEDDIIATNFVKKLSTVEKSVKTTIISEVSKKILLVERTFGKKAKTKIAIEIYDLLTTKDGIDFCYSHWRFHKTILMKLCEFYYKDEISVMGDYFKTIYGSSISLDLYKAFDPVGSQLLSIN